MNAAALKALCWEQHPGGTRGRKAQDRPLGDMHCTDPVPQATSPMAITAEGIEHLQGAAEAGERRLHLCGGIRDTVNLEVSKCLLGLPKSNTIRLNLPCYSFLGMGSRMRGCSGASRTDTERKPLIILQGML